MGVRVLTSEQSLMDTGAWFVELEVRVLTDTAHNLPTVITKWSGELRRILSTGRGRWAPGYRVGFVAWTKITLRSGETPGTETSRLLAWLRRFDPGAELVTRWGRTSDHVRSALKDPSPGQERPP